MVEGLGNAGGNRGLLRAERPLAEAVAAHVQFFRDWDAGERAFDCVAHNEGWLAKQADRLERDVDVTLATGIWWKQRRKVAALGLSKVWEGFKDTEGSEDGVVWTTAEAAREVFGGPSGEWPHFGGFVLFGRRQIREIFEFHYAMARLEARDDDDSDGTVIKEIIPRTANTAMKQASVREHFTWVNGQPTILERLLWDLAFQAGLQANANERHSP